MSNIIAPVTLEGWYALHQVLRIDWDRLRDEDQHALIEDTQALAASLSPSDRPGWSAAFRVIGSGADLMLIHFRETLAELADAQLAVRKSRLGSLLDVVYDFISVAEAGLYHATADAAAEAKPYSKEFEALVREAAEAERASPHVRTRLYPTPPDDMRVVSFYPMSKRRVHPDNWYVQGVEERNRMMREHGLSGRRWAGRIFQIVTGAVGFDDWEWGVTLFARDPLDIKGVVTELRYDEASSRFGEFGSFFVGVRLAPEEWRAFLSV